MHKLRVAFGRCFLVAASLAVSNILAASEGPRAIWPMYRGGPQRTGQSAFKGPAPMRVKWEVDLKCAICASPAIGPDGTIYVGAGTVFYAISPAGQILWSHSFAESGHTRPGSRGGATGDTPAFTSPCPALGPDGTLYQVCGRGPYPEQSYVIALDSRPKAESRVKWALKTGDELRASPLLVDRSCFTASCDQWRILSLDGDGKRKWPAAAAAPYGATSSPALSRDGKTLYVGGLDGRLHAVDAQSGKAKWTAGPATRSTLRLPDRYVQEDKYRPFTTAGQVPEAPAVGPDGTVYFGSWDGHLYAAAPDGRLRWSVDFEDRVTSAPAVSKEGRILVSTYEGTLYCVRPLGGKPTVDWQVEANARYSSPLVSSDGKVYVGTLDGKLRCYAIQGGRQLGELAFEGWVYASPVPGGDGRLYVGASDGRLRAIEAGGPSSIGSATAPAAARDIRQQLASTPARAATTGRGQVPRSGPMHSGTSGYDEALRLARAYLAENDETKRAEILRKMEGWSERLDEIAMALRPVPPAGARTGYIPEDRFTLPRVRASLAKLQPAENGPLRFYKDVRPAPGEEHMNWVYVPEKYDPKKPLGLVINLHGGGGSTLQSAAAKYLEGDSEDASLLRGGDFVAVCPSTPPMEPKKWSYPESEIHIQSIIEEYSVRYAIDPNRVYLIGYSMGGIGGWWHALRQSDRFALVAPIAGLWQWAYWPRLRGTLVYMMNGAFDHHTHVDFPRYAHQRLKALDIPHVDAEYLGAHLRLLARPQMDALFELVKTTRRDPYCPHACVISPFIWDTSEAARRRYPDDPYSFWVSVLEAGPGGVLVERQARNERNTFAPERHEIKAGAVDAKNLGGNRFRIQVTNVKRFALWLHPEMGVDFAKPVEIELIQMAVDPQTKTETERRRQKVTATARPSLAAMLKYLGDRRDFGLIYHAAVKVEVGSNDGR